MHYNHSSDNNASEAALQKESTVRITCVVYYLLNNRLSNDKINEIIYL